MSMEFDPRDVRRLLRKYERAASELCESTAQRDSITFEDDFPEDPLVVTIVAAGGTATIEFRDPTGEGSVVMGLEDLRRRIRDL